MSVPAKRDPPRRGLEQTGQDRQQRGLAAAARPERQDDLAVPRPEREIVKRAEAVRAERVLDGQSLDAQVGRSRCSHDSCSSKEDLADRKTTFLTRTGCLHMEP